MVPRGDNFLRFQTQSFQGRSNPTVRSGTSHPPRSKSININFVSLNEKNKRFASGLKRNEQSLRIRSSREMIDCAAKRRRFRECTIPRGLNDPCCPRVRFVSRHRECRSEQLRSGTWPRPGEQGNRLIVSPNNGSSVKAALSWFQRLRREASWLQERRNRESPTEDEGRQGREDGEMKGCACRRAIARTFPPVDLFNPRLDATPNCSRATTASPLCCALFFLHFVSGHAHSAVKLQWTLRVRMFKRLCFSYKGNTV